MKISTEQLAALQESEIQRKKTPAAEGFDSLFNEQLSGTQSQGVASSVHLGNSQLAGLMSPALAGQIVGMQTDPVSMEAFQDVATRMEGIFSGLEEYAAALADTGGTTLRHAHSNLEKMNSEIASLKNAHPNLQDMDPELAAMVGELEVLAATETFKLNRGDYL